MNHYRKPSLLLWMVTLITVYFGLYAVLLERKVYRPTGVWPSTGQNLFAIEPNYRIEHAGLRATLIPAHQLDRAVRREFWTTIETSGGIRWKNPTANIEK